MAESSTRTRRGLGPTANVSLAALVLLIAFIVIGPHVYSASTTLVAGAERLKPPSKAHPFGTDQFGREVLARVMAGGQQSLRVASLTMALTVVAGSLLGLVAGSVRGLDEILMRISDAFLALPAVILAIALMAVREPSEANVVLALVVVYTPRIARVVRGNFLGVGPPPPAPSWGNMLSEARYLVRDAFWISFFPGLFIGLAVLSANVLGDGIRDRYDPRRGE